MKIRIAVPRMIDPPMSNFCWDDEDEKGCCRIGVGGGCELGFRVGDTNGDGDIPRPQACIDAGSSKKDFARRAREVHNLIAHARITLGLRDAKATTKDVIDAQVALGKALTETLQLCMDMEKAQ